MRRDFFTRESQNDVNIFQRSLAERLALIFNKELISTEWSAAISPDIYSPRLDLAVGPFAFVNSLIFEYDELIRDPLVLRFLRELQSAHVRNLERNDYYNIPTLDEKLFMNLNARCFLSIEIENAVTQKHVIGGIVNASALGRLGVLIPWNERQLRSFVRTLNYLGFLKTAGKNTFDITNIFIITREQMDEILLSIQRSE